MKYALACSALLSLSLGACKKSSITDSLGGSTSGSTSTIAVAARLTNNGAPTDSLYLLHGCAPGLQCVPVSEAALPGAIGTYLGTNYSGYTFGKAFAFNDSSGSTGAYIVVIYFNGKPVGLEFDAGGAFVRVLEQREHGDCNGGPGHGGRFHDRDGQHRDSIALTALPSGITAYMSSNYPGDTLVKAFRGCDSSIVILSQNGVLYATAFDASGNFLSRIQVQQHHGRGIDISQAQLPAAALSYLGTTYPNYVFERAFQLMSGSSVQGYVAIIDASGTKYAVEFDASGNYVRDKVIH